jgi:hypothetical protein
LKTLIRDAETTCRDLEEEELDLDCARNFVSLLKD